MVIKSAIIHVAIPTGGPAAINLTTALPFASGSQIKLARFFWGRDPAEDGVGVVQNQRSVGAYDGTNQWATSWVDRHNIVTARNWRAGLVGQSGYLLQPNTGVIQGLFNATGFITDGVSINVSTFPAVVASLYVVLWADDRADLRVKVGTGGVNFDPGDFEDTVVDFDPDLVFVDTMGPTVPARGTRICRGVWSKRTDIQACVAWSAAETNPSQCALTVFDNRILNAESPGSSVGGLVLGEIRDGFRLTIIESAGTFPFAYVAMAFGGTMLSSSHVVLTPDAPGIATESAPGFELQAAEFLNTPHLTINAQHVGVRSGAVGSSYVLEDDSAAIVGSSQDAISPTSTQVRSESDAVLVVNNNHVPSIRAVRSGDTFLDLDGVRLDWLTVTGTERQQILVAYGIFFPPGSTVISESAGGSRSAAVASGGQRTRNQVASGAHNRASMGGARSSIAAAGTRSGEVASGGSRPGER